jgi:hypothetical protein
MEAGDIVPELGERQSHPWEDGPPSTSRGVGAMPYSEPPRQDPTYTPDLRDIVIRSQGPNLLVERGLAMACGFDFRIGVLSSTHKDELERAFPELEGLIVVMDWC